MPEFMTEPCKPDSFYIIELPKVQRKGESTKIETSHYRAPERRVRGVFTADEAAIAYRQMIDTEPKRANECAIWFSGNIAG